jgi:hypothetical protein
MKTEQQVHKMQENVENCNNYQNKGFETEQNLREFFYLLLKIDMRNHPEYYKTINNESILILDNSRKIRYNNSVE